MIMFVLSRNFNLPGKHKLNIYFYFYLFIYFFNNLCWAEFEPCNKQHLVTWKSLAFTAQTAWPVQKKEKKNHKPHGNL